MESSGPTAVSSAAGTAMRMTAPQRTSPLRMFRTSSRMPKTTTPAMAAMRSAADAMEMKFCRSRLRS